MSLLSEAMENCTLYSKSVQRDSMGGYTTVWTAGITFACALVKENSVENKIAEAQNVKAIYTITTSRDLTLSYHDVIRRNKDKKIFRVTSDGIDVKTPLSASLDMRQVTAEEWEFPSGDIIQEADNEEG